MEEMKYLPEKNYMVSLVGMHSILQEKFKLCRSSPSSDGLDLLPSWGAPQQCCCGLSGLQYTTVCTHPVHVKGDKIGPNVMKIIPLTTCYSATSHKHPDQSLCKYPHDYRTGDNIGLCGYIVTLSTSTYTHRNQSNVS